MKDTIYRLPQEFIHKLKKIYPHRFPAVCETFLHRKIPAFRINYLKTDLMNLRKMLKQERVKYKELPWPKGSFLLTMELRTFQQSYLYKEGYIYVQNVSSMVPPVILDPQPQEKILDLCAAPGAKTTQLVSLGNREIELVVVEKIRTRYYKLLANLKAQGIDWIEPYLLDGIWVRKKFPEYFDKILLDAPCSCEGLFYVHNPHSFKYWKLRKVKEMSHKQKKLIAAAVYALKEGGTLIYSTCTFSPEENEMVIDWVLNKFKDTLEIIPLTLPLTNAIPGLCRWKDKKFSASLSGSVRIIPHEFMEAFYIVQLKKTG
ncbi:MAG: RsmB/NOP family class I SAM-dependent RNA methyltransferase [Candidatus Omnitrophica bacterium]|nr:RsmB/NOP family class I SAM-dependent RNA methyltransferase [Candidatus Omnitrophota bacterium]